ncbi:hypothetical protein F4703DRAFT_1882856, partial [Phycomyces blakesleeanus]
MIPFIILYPIHTHTLSLSLYLFDICSSFVQYHLVSPPFFYIFYIIYIQYTVTVQIFFYYIIIIIIIILLLFVFSTC